MRLALFQPDIAGNVGTLIRLGACLGVPVDIIEPCGFAFSLRALKRSGMDYLDTGDVTVHADWQAFRAARPNRLVLLTTRAALTYTAATYHADDILLVGQESAGVPDDVRAAAGLAVRIPMQASMRSLNVAVAAAMVTGEALRQTGGFAG